MLICNSISLSLSDTYSIADGLVQKWLMPIITDFTPKILYLNGNLGSGKTTFMRGLLKSFGFDGAVKSPTYTIVETYNKLIVPIYHFDLYRVNSVRELELIGIRDYLQDNAICCFEWPLKSSGFPQANFTIDLEIITENQRHILIEQIEHI